MESFGHRVRRAHDRVREKIPQVLDRDDRATPRIRRSDGIGRSPDCSQPAHVMGRVWERISIGVFLLWDVVVAVILLRALRGKRSE